MKDKLHKTGHKKAWYRMKTLGVSLAAFLGLAAVVSIPTAVTYLAEEQRLAAEAPVETPEEEAIEVVSYVEE